MKNINKRVPYEEKYINQVHIIINEFLKNGIKLQDLINKGGIPRVSNVRINEKIEIEMIDYAKSQYINER